MASWRICILSSSGGDDLAHTDRPSESDQTRLDYWSELMKYMKGRKSFIRFNEPSSKLHQLRAKAETFGSDKFILVALANLRPSRIGVGVEISGPEEYYAALAKDKFSIDSEIGHMLGDKQTVEWDSKTKVRDMWLYWSADFHKRQQWPEQH
ncbi:MAG: DUF4268 domain-containing protein [Pyrinomonadaceae bacterium]